MEMYTKEIVMKNKEHIKIMTQQPSTLLLLCYFMLYDCVFTAGCETVCLLGIIKTPCPLHYLLLVPKLRERKLF